MAQREGSRTLSEVLKPLGLTSSQSEVLRVLYDHEPMSLIELGNMLVCETGSPSRLVNRLIAADLIAQEASKVDARKVVLTLTPEGKEKVQKIVEIEEKFYASIESMLIGKPVQELIDLLWMQVKGKPSGNALELRKASENGGDGRD